jgi:exopolyphosphatase / guanosine-5'-triphosphate,3'-diphosphate pyrophosphatase
MLWAAGKQARTMATLLGAESGTKPTSGIALRWEWRSFGQRFGGAEERIARFAPSEPKETDEIYFLSRGGENVKVRDDLMDVKVLREVNKDGLERWAPVMKAGFPLSANDVAAVLDALDVSIHGSLSEGCTLEALLDAFDRPDSGVRLVRVHKRRVRYTVEGCMAELSDITANGEPVRTIAVESEDAHAIIRAVESLHLSGYANTNYLRGLAALLDHEPERYAVIDVGTNSVKFHVASRDREGRWTTISDHAELTRLGEGLADTGKIGDAPLKRTADAIAEMAAEAKRQGVRAIAAVGTAGLRIAANSADAIAAIRERSGVKVDVVSGDDEARLAYLATTAALGPAFGSIAVFDTGGGSSQFTFGQKGRIEERFSVDVGAARYTEQFELDREVSEDMLEQAMAQISADLARLDGRPSPDLLVGMGGAMTNITAVALGLAEYDPSRVQGALITSDEIDRQIELYRSRDADARRSIIGLQPKRAEVILAGACVVRTLLQKLNKTSVTVSDRGLRHGVLAERFGD